jgi:hypothetical protein
VSRIAAPTCRERSLAGATTIELSGQATGVEGSTINFEHAYPLAEMQTGARKVGAMIATTVLPALGGHSVQARCHYERA